MNDILKITCFYITCSVYLKAGLYFVGLILVLIVRKQRFVTLVLPDVLLIISQTFARVRTGILSQDCDVLQACSALET
jgi:hypothetical protein